MRYRSYESTSPKKVLTYFFYVICIFWVLVTLILGYQFLNEKGETVNEKGGTFVEAIFNQISYLPYLKNDGQSIFYQSFLFDACTDYTHLAEEGLEGTNCKLITQDYQTYYVSVDNNEKTRSDGAPRSLDDVLFTYDTIIRQNVWDIKTLNAYQDVKIEKEENRIKVVFPTGTSDNNYFFTYYILPKHILENAKYGDYIGVFAANPITSGCGKIQPKSNDSQSLVFNVVNCKETNLGYYQIKNYPDFESFSKSVINEGNKIVDMYAHQLLLDNYSRKNIIRSDILSFFFNTKSPKMKVRLRRALGGLINSKFYMGDEYGKFLKMYTDPLLAKFYSDGSNIKEFINRVSLTEEEEGVDQQDLEDSGVQPLKPSISINGVERKFVFYTPKRDETFNLEIKFSNQFENIKITDNRGNTFSPKNYKKTDKKLSYPLELGKNLKSGLNQYTIVGTIKDKTYTIANIDLYMIDSIQENNSTEEDVNAWKINIIYYNNLESNFAIKQLKKILEDAEILDNFTFEQISSPEALEAKLVVGDYDIILNTINIGMKKDILRILTTTDATINPSKYTNPNLTNLYKQYTKASQKDTIVDQINAIFAQDMPMVIVGYPYDFANLKTELMESAFDTDAFMYEYNRREYLYHHITLLKTKNINFKDLKDIRGFFKYMFDTLERDSSIFEKKPSQLQPQEEKKEEIENTTTPSQNENTTIEKLDTTINEGNNTGDPFEGLLKPTE